MQFFQGFSYQPHDDMNYNSFNIQNFSYGNTVNYNDSTTANYKQNNIYINGPHYTTTNISNSNNYETYSPNSLSYENSYNQSLSISNSNTTSSSENSFTYSISPPLYNNSNHSSVYQNNVNYYTTIPMSVDSLKSDQNKNLKRKLNDSNEMGSNSADNQNESPNKPPKSKSKKHDQIKCEICGDSSSGYHYGAYTCEACKLFFTRTVKNQRKRKFLSCYSKNCDVSIESRSLCSECRFKKCIAIGMSIGRSRYGRHKIPQNLTIKLEPKPNISAILLHIHSKTKQNIENILNYFTSGKISSFDLIQNLKYQKKCFYNQSMELIVNDKPNLKWSNANAAAVDNNEQDSKQQLISLALFSVFFDINLSPLNSFSINQLSTSLKELVSLLERDIFETCSTNTFITSDVNMKNIFKFLPSLKIIVYIYIMYNILQSDCSMDEDISTTKIVLDLLRSEISVLYTSIISKTIPSQMVNSVSENYKSTNFSKTTTNGALGDNYYACDTQISNNSHNLLEITSSEIILWTGHVLDLLNSYSIYF